MKTFTIIALTLLFCSCTKKQVPFFQNSTQPSHSSKNNIAENIATQNIPQTQDFASISSNKTFLKEDFSKENNKILIEEKTILKPKIQKKERVKLKQVFQIKQSFSGEKPNYYNLSKGASAFGFITLGLIFLAFALAFFSSITYSSILVLLVLSFISANIALIFGSVSVKKVQKKGKARFGIVIGIIWDIFLVGLLFLLR